MNITSSYSVQIIKLDNPIRQTVQIYRLALSFLIKVYADEWENLQAVKGSNSQFNFAEKLIHTTKQNTANYKFDEVFPKMPSYLRRAAVKAALGSVSSYKSNYANWKTNSKKGKEPKLQCDRNAMPVFYNKEMYSESNEPNTAWLKLFVRNDWVWVKIRLLATDVNYINRRWSHIKAMAPILEKRHKQYYLRFAFTESVKLSDVPVNEQKICAVDLGLNSDAVCSIMCSDGTVLARKFINFPSEKDHLWHMLNRIKKQQREHGNKSIVSLWEYTRRCNNQLTIKIATAITDFAVLYGTDVIVFEHLDFKNKKAKGSRKQRLAMWRKNGIQDFVLHKAHRCAIRISHICAWGTSRLAYDGSGILSRDENNRALATFANGKQYNCDLSASYNIGARYFIREILKPLSETVRSQLTAKVPQAERRTSCTYATLIELNRSLVA